MIDVFDLYMESCGTMNTAQGGHMKPETQFVQWVNDISLMIQQDLIAEWEKTQVISEALKFFLRSVNVMVTPQPGEYYDLVKFPPDYKHYSSGRLRKTIEDKVCACEGIDVLDVSGNLLDWEKDCQHLVANAATVEPIPLKKVANNQFDAAVRHRTMKPGLNNPIVTLFDKGMKLAPKQVPVVTIDYFRMPKHAKFAYTVINPGTESEYIQYDAANSEPLEWDIMMKPRFIKELQLKYGNATRDQGLYDRARDALQTSVP